MTVVRLEDVSKRFRRSTVIRGASLVLEDGLVYRLVGANGSGKSVMLRLMCGLMQPDEGEVTIDQRFLSAGRSYPDYFGVTIDGPAYLGHLSAIDNLVRLASIRKRASNEELHALLGELGLDASSRKPVRSFSSGMKQKLSLAQALMESPKVLLLDEPFNALDRESVDRVKTMIHRRIELGATVVLTSHTESDLLSFSGPSINIENSVVTVSA